VPGTFNYKVKNGVPIIKPVYVIDRWDGRTVCKAEMLYDEFYADLKKGIKPDRKYSSSNNNTITQQQPPANILDQFLLERRMMHNNNTGRGGNYVGSTGVSDSDSGVGRPQPWIETLLTLPLADCRKYCVWRILAPYYINTLHLPFEEANARICQWLERCDRLKRLTFPIEPRVNAWIESVDRKRCYPISFDNPEKKDNLQKDNPELYQAIKQQMDKNNYGGVTAK
jgi:hypothetical protein